MGDNFVISIKKLSSPEAFTIQVAADCRILNVKEVIHAREGITPSLQRLLLDGRRLEDDESLGESGVSDGSTLVLLMYEYSETTEDKFLCHEGYDIAGSTDGTSCIIRKLEHHWQHTLSSVAFRRGRFRVVIDEKARTGAAINIGVADAADKPDDVKENYIVWINDNAGTPFPEGFFWNGTMDGKDTGGFIPKGLALDGGSTLRLDVIVQNRQLIFAVEGQEPIVAFKSLPEMVRPYIFMYGPNEVTYFPPVVRVMTVQVTQIEPGTLQVVCTSLSGQVVTVEAEASQTVGALNAKLHADLPATPNAVDLQLVSDAGHLLDDELTLADLCS